MSDPDAQNGDAEPMTTRVAATRGPVNRNPKAPALPSAVIHELRTPLTAIHGYAQLLKRNVADIGLVDRSVDIILRESGRMSNLLKQLSEVAELDNGSVMISPMPTNVVDLAQSVAADTGFRSDKHEIVVEGESIEARVDPRRVSQILAHLLSNALTYAPHGGRISICIERQDGDVHVTVTDPGIGVPPEDDGRIYERFYRGTNAERIGARGLGLGLYVTHELASRFGGKLWHSARDDGGTVFHVVIPEL